jgi:hypothetical protein
MVELTNRYIKRLRPLMMALNAELDNKLIGHIEYRERAAQLREAMIQTMLAETAAADRQAREKARRSEGRKERATLFREYQRQVQLSNDREELDILRIRAEVL